MSLTAAGIGSGLDVESIISQLMAIERQPLLAVQQQQQVLDANLSAFGQLKSSLSGFQTAMESLSETSAFKVFTASSTNESVFTATATSSAAASSFDVEVVRLAERHKMASAEYADTTTFGGAAGDQISIQVGTDIADTLVVDLSSALTLSGVRDAINAATDNPGVTATIVAGNNGNEKLIFTSEESGAASALTLSYGGAVTAATFDFQTVNDIAGDTSLLDAEIAVDGYTITRSSNTISDAIQGITLNLIDVDVGTEHTLSIDRDNTSVAESVQEFADAFNGLRSTITDLRVGSLEGDSTLLAMERRLMSIINTPASGLSSGLQYLAEIGLSISKEGTMSVDETALDSVLAGDFNAVADLFATVDEGFANRLDTQITSWLETDGLIDIREDGIETRQRLLEDRELALDRRLELIEARFRSQFTALDALLGNLQATSSFLTQQLPLLTNANQ